jgi:deazaflavin-dependent oxidoreductase (nitroreductase family)
MWFNPIMRVLLRSPLHSLVSKDMMLMTYTGRKSGKLYTTPMNYLIINGALYTVSTRERVWWRNLRGGAEVSLRLRGREVPALAESIEDPNEVAQLLEKIFAADPRLTRYMDVRLSPDGSPNSEDVVRLAQEKVVVSTRLK